MILLYLSYLSLLTTATWVASLLTVTVPPFAVADVFMDFFGTLGTNFAIVSNAIGVDVSLPLSLLGPTFYILFTILVLRFASFSAKRAILMGVLFGLVSVFF